MDSVSHPATIRALNSLAAYAPLLPSPIPNKPPFSHLGIAPHQEFPPLLSPALPPSPLPPYYQPDVTDALVPHNVGLVVRPIGLPCAVAVVREDRFVVPEYRVQE